MVEVLTDNKNRAAQQVRLAFKDAGGELQSPGGLDYNFRHVGVVDVRCTRGSHEDALLELALSAGCDELEWPGADTLAAEGAAEAAVEHHAHHDLGSHAAEPRDGDGHAEHPPHSAGPDVARAVCDRASLQAVARAFRAEGAMPEGCEVLKAEAMRLPLTTVELDQDDQQEDFAAFLHALEDLEDV